MDEASPSPRIQAPLIEQILEIASEADDWVPRLGMAALIDLRRVALRYGDLLSQEAIAVTARLTRASLVPTNWKQMTPGPRVDAIKRIVDTIFDADARSRAAIAIRLNKDLQSYLRAQRGFLPDARARAALIASAGGACGLCGRRFSKAEIECFRAGHPRKADLRDRDVYDQWKPIFTMRHGWTIDVDHRVPLAVGGADDIDNMHMACHYCNAVKREWVSIFDRPMSFGRAAAAEAWQFHALKLMAVEGCFRCKATVKTAELTIAPYCPEGTLTLQNLFVTCYGHDPCSKLRWLRLQDTRGI